MKILVVDDNYAGRRLLGAFLRDFGHIDTASNGLEAVEAFMLALGNDEAYDLIFMDIMMPELDGLQALEQIRVEEKKSGTKDENRVRVVMNSAVDEKEEIKRALDLGCCGYLIKPVDDLQMRSLLKELGIQKTE